jgi:hypothetical protein
MLESLVPDFSCIAAQDKKSSKFDAEKLRISLWEWRALGMEVVYHLCSFPWYGAIATRIWTSLGIFWCETFSSLRVLVFGISLHVGSQVLYLPSSSHIPPKYV